MKTRLKRVFAACIACLVLLMSVVLPVAASDNQVTSLGYFDYVSVDCSIPLFVYEDGSFDDDISVNTWPVASDLLFDDSATLVRYCKSSFYTLSDRLYSLESEGFFAPSVTITFSFPVGKFLLDDFCLYSSSPTAFYVGEYPSSGDSYNFIDDVSLIVRSDTGLFRSVSCVWISGRWIPILDGTSVSYGSDFEVSSFSFTIRPDYTFDRQHWLSIMAARLGYSADGQEIDAPTALKFWGYPGLYFDAASVDSARQDGYDRGYANGSHDGYFIGYDDGLSVGRTEGAVSGRQEGYNSGLSEGLITGRAEGEEIGYDKAITENKDAWIQAGFNSGYQRALQLVNTDTNLSMRELLFSVVNAPVEVFVNTFNFDFLGFNLASFFTSLLTIAIVGTVFILLVKKIL